MHEKYEKRKKKGNNVSLIIISENMITNAIDKHDKKEKWTQTWGLRLIRYARKTMKEKLKLLIVI